VLNKLIVALMPLAPRAIVKLISNRYIAGEDTPAALEKCKQLKRQGYATTIDILGESVTSEDQANLACSEYLQLIDDVVASGIEKNISLKPTALGLGLSEELGFANITRVVQKAHDAGVFIRIDMEDSPYTDQTLQIYSQLKADYPKLGTVIQAYMHRSLKDVISVASQSGNLRICKGIYKESPGIAYQDKAEVRDNYMALIREMFQAGAYVGIATHDTLLIDKSLELISEMKPSKDKYEFQALLGVPMENRLAELVEAGHKVRVYVPFGQEWYAYSSRRLKENPDMAGYILKNLFIRK